MDAFTRCFQQRAQIGAIALVVHALDDTARQFCEHFGFLALEDHPLHLYLPMESIAQLFRESQRKPTSH
jgi:hypothetical protein